MKNPKSYLNSFYYWSSPLDPGPFYSQQEALLFELSFQIQTIIYY